MRSTSRKRLAVCRLVNGLQPVAGGGRRPWIPDGLGFGSLDGLVSNLYPGYSLFAPVHDAAPACAPGAEQREVLPL